MTADIVEATEFPALAQRFNVYAVPKTVVNDTHEFVGALPEAHFVAAVARAAGGEAQVPGEEAPAEAEATRLDPGPRSGT